MNRIVTSILILAASAAPAFAGDWVPVTHVPEPATMTLFGLGAGGAYLAKRLLGRK